MSPAKPAVRDEVRYVLDALKSAIRILGYTVRDIENKLRYSHGYLSRVFAGTIELKMEHVIDVARALEVDPEELLAFVYPTLKDPASPAAYELWQRVGGQPPGPSGGRVRGFFDRSLSRTGTAPRSFPGSASPPRRGRRHCGSGGRRRCSRRRCAAPARR